MFGSQTTSSLFGKPASGGLFGANTTTSAGTGPGAGTTGTAPSSGGLVGSSTSTGGLFGSNTNTSSNTNTGTSSGSLFGTNANTGTNTGGLFGSNTGTTNTNTGTGFGLGNTGTGTGTSGNTTGSSGSSLFGNTGFGNTNTPSNTNTNTGLFGSTLTSSATTPSLFGTQNTNSLGNPGNNPGNNPGLAGNTLGSSTFGNTLTNNNNSNNNNSNITGILNVNDSLGLSTLDSLPNLGQSKANGNGSGAYFDSLFATSRRHKPAEEQDNDILPPLHLGIGDIRQRLRTFNNHASGANGKSSSNASDGRAHYLLAASGVDPTAADKDLDLLGLGRAGVSASGPQTHALPEVDVETYLSNLQSKTTLSMISDSLDRSTQSFDDFLEDNMALEWDLQRKKIYQHFGISYQEPDKKSSTDTPANASGTSTMATGGFGRSKRKTGASRMQNSILGTSFRQSTLGTSSRIGPHPPEFSDVDRSKTDGLFGAAHARSLREREVLLAHRIADLNAARLHNKPYPILTELHQVQDPAADAHSQHLSQAYQALMAMVGEESLVESLASGLPPTTASPKPRQFITAWLDDQESSASSIALRKRILDGANRFLEGQFWQSVESMIAKHPHEANLGGRPDIVSKVRAYIRLRASRRDLVPDNTELQQVQGEYVWAMVFYLLRSGHLVEAAQYVNEHLGSFRGIDRMFSTYLNSYASSEDRRLKRQLQDRCQSEYTQRSRGIPEHGGSNVDPFRMACYKIIGRCELGNRSLDGLNTDIHDWIWLQFNLARESERSYELANETHGLLEVQTSIKEIGAKHFPKSAAEDTNGSFGMFFYLQILCGLFEEAIAYLYSFSYVDAVHVAVALAYYGLLRPSDPVTADNELLSTNTRGKAQINFGRMLGYYTRDFRAANVDAAVDYLTLICLNGDLPGEAGQRHARLCHEALQELVLETREFSKLLGDIRPDGRRLQGEIALRGPLIGLVDEHDFMNTVTIQAAQYADEAGRITDSVLLYHLAGEYDTVVSIVNRALSEAVALEIGESPMVLMPMKPRGPGSDAPANESNDRSLSLAAIDDPIELAQTMWHMYKQNAMFASKISEANASACELLLQMSDVKRLLEAGRWADCLDALCQLDVLPLMTRGDAGLIRHYAARFAALPSGVASNVPNLVFWAVHCCTQQRDQLLRGDFTASGSRSSGSRNLGNGQESSTRQLMIRQLRQMILDLVTYTSQLRYRFPPHLHEALARASAE